MSVSGWETRSIASSVATDDRRSHRHQHPHMQQSTRAQFRPQTPQYEPRNHMSSTASQSSHVSRHRDPASRHRDPASRHSSFPVQQQQHLEYIRHADNQQQYQQQQQQPRRQSMHRNERQEPAPYREQERPSNVQRRSSVSSATSKRQPQPQTTLQYEQYGWQQDQHKVTESRKAPSNYGDDEFRRPAAANGQRRSSVSRQSNQTSYHQEEYQQPSEPLEDDYYEPSPPPPPFKRQVSPPAAKPATAPLDSVDEEPVNIDDILLGKRYSVHVISHLFHFQRLELGDYANELVKFLRGHAVMAYEEEFGYSVIIKYTSECVVFQVVETRDLHAEFLIERLEQPQRPESKPMDKNALQDEDVRQRSGAFVIYFPKSAEDAPSKLRIHRRSQGSHSNENGSDNSHGSNGNASQSRGDAKYAFLVRGNEELMSWVSSWVQRRFQCAVGRHVVRITDENLRRVARNWVIESLEREERHLRGLQRKSEKMQKTAGDDPVHNDATMQSKPPILLKYRTKKTSEAVKSFTLTMPWASVRRVHAAMDSGVSSVLGSIPEVLETLEQQYFGNLEKDLKEMELVGFQMEEVEVDVLGKIKFFKSSMIHSILQSYLDIFAVQQQPAPNEAESTF